MLKLTVHLQGWHSSFSQAFHQEDNLRVIYFHPRENKIPYGASAIYVLCKIPLPTIGLHPEAKNGYIWKWLCLGLTEFYWAFGFWRSWHGCTEVSIPLRQAKRGVIGALQVNATWRNEPRARKAERPAAPFGLISYFFPSRKRPSAQSAKGIQRPSA